MRTPAAIYQIIHEQAQRPGRWGAFLKNFRKRVL
jgi:hypothetical protein